MSVILSIKEELEADGLFTNGKGWDVGDAYVLMACDRKRAGEHVAQDYSALPLNNPLEGGSYFIWVSKDGKTRKNYPAPPPDLPMEDPVLLF